MTEYKVKIIGDYGTYDSLKEWQRAEKPEDFFRQQNKLTLRDKFAIHSPIMTNQWWADSKLEDKHWVDAQAAFAYKYADAMIKERDKI